MRCEKAQREWLVDMRERRKKGSVVLMHVLKALGSSWFVSQKMFFLSAKINTADFTTTSELFKIEQCFQRHKIDWQDCGAVSVIGAAPGRR